MFDKLKIFFDEHPNLQRMLIACGGAICCGLIAVPVLFTAALTLNGCNKSEPVTTVTEIGTSVEHKAEATVRYERWSGNNYQTRQYEFKIPQGDTYEICINFRGTGTPEVVLYYNLEFLEMSDWQAGVSEAFIPLEDVAVDQFDTRHIYRGYESDATHGTSCITFTNSPDDGIGSETVAWSARMIPPSYVTNGGNGEPSDEGGIDNGSPEEND